jgi:hypothetical protein
MHSGIKGAVGFSGTRCQLERLLRIALTLEWLRMSNFRERKLNLDAEAAAVSVLRADAAVVSSDRSVRDGEAQPEAIDRSIRAAAIERLEDPSGLARRHAGPVIPDDKPRALAGC